MKPATKNKIARSLGTNRQLNKKVLTMKSSWDEVGSILQKAPFPKKTPKK